MQDEKLCIFILHYRKKSPIIYKSIYLDGGSLLLEQIVEDKNGNLLYTMRAGA